MVLHKKLASGIPVVPHKLVDIYLRDKINNRTVNLSKFKSVHEKHVHPISSVDFKKFL